MMQIWTVADTPVGVRRLAQVTLIEFRCALRTLSLLAAGRLKLPTAQVGRVVRFADGSTSTVYRETALVGGPATSDVVLAVTFRLRFVGTNRLLHTLFRVESMLNTLLFAGHAGFRTKLWMTDLDTGVYRGIYEWSGRTAAVDYLRVLRVVLLPWAQRESFGCRVMAAPSRAPYLAGSAVPPGEDGDRWWRPVAEPAPLDAGTGQ
jgi:hypothetical protein